MRLPPLAVALALLSAGCHGSATEPYRTTTDAAPSGLPTFLRTAPSYQEALPAAPSITAAGDSIVAAAALSVSGCIDYAATAGLSGSVLVVTITSSFPDVPRYCTMNAATATFRAVVRPAPSGRYDVVFRTRDQAQAGAPAFYERELARASVTLR